MECVELEDRHLEDPVRLDMPGVDFEGAWAAAKRAASKVYQEPMLLAWYDRGRGRFSPRVECCGEDMPSWLVYARNRGGDVEVAVNGLSYVFVFRGP